MFNFSRKLIQCSTLNTRSSSVHLQRHTKRNFNFYFRPELMVFLGAWLFYTKFRQRRFGDIEDNIEASNEKKVRQLLQKREFPSYYYARLNKKSKEAVEKRIKKIEQELIIYSKGDLIFGLILFVFGLFFGFLHFQINIQDDKEKKRKEENQIGEITMDILLFSLAALSVIGGGYHIYCGMSRRHAMKLLQSAKNIEKMIAAKCMP